MPMAFSQDPTPIVRELFVLSSNRVFPETRKSVASQNATARRSAVLLVMPGNLSHWNKIRSGGGLIQQNRGIGKRVCDPRDGACAVDLRFWLLAFTGPLKRSELLLQ